METAIWVAIISTIPATMLAVGKGIGYVIGLIQDQHKATVDAKNEEIAALKERNKILEERVAACERDHQ